MKFQNWGIGAALVFALCAGVAWGQASGWTHDPAGANGPFHWGAVAAPYATCGSAAAGSTNVVAVGMAQSPVNIETSKAVLAVLPEIGFHYNSTPFEVENNGHAVEVPYAAGSSLRRGNSVTEVYQLAQFHFHAPSEHTIDGKHFDAELHLVHKNILGQLVVVGVLLSKSASAPAGVFDDIVKAAPATEGTGKHEELSLNANSLLPVDKGYFTYKGSLTTPPCTEGVHWFVMKTPVAVSAFVIQQLHSVAGHFPGYNGFENNNRLVTALNGRTVLVGQ